MSNDPFAAKRAAMRDEFFAKLFLLGGFPGGTDTYKRTMWAAVPEIALLRASYTLVMRKGLPEPEAQNQLVMAGHEAMLAQWFHRPLKRDDIELAEAWFTTHASVRAYPRDLWRSILDAQPGPDIRLPVDIYGLPGGQTFLPGVPCLVFEGPGGAISYLEPAMCRYFAPVIWATKGRIMSLVTPRDAEFGLRSAPDEVQNIILLLARYVGGRGRLTSNDNAEFLFPELFRSIGTIGHEMMSAAQAFDKTLTQAEYEMMDRFVSAMGNASLLCDLVDAETVGLVNVLRVMKGHPENEKVGIRVDSGNIAEQCVLYFRRMREAGLSTRTIVFENEVSPEAIRQVYDHFRKMTGEEPTMLFPGAGGYWWRLVHRDTLSAAFKRSGTGSNPNIKFSNDVGKESLPGYLRVYERDDVLVVADAIEGERGVPLFVPLVRQGRIVYQETFEEQADRADRTWGRYRRIELSPLVQANLDRFRKMRQQEVAAARLELTSFCR